MTDPVTDGSVDSPLSLDATQPRGELAVHPTHANAEFSGRVIEVDYERSTLLVRYEGAPPEVGINVTLASLPAPRCPVCGQTHCECPPGAQEVVRKMMAMTKERAAGVDARIGERSADSVQAGVHGVAGNALQGVSPKGTDDDQ
jgi:hypothetical protein